MATKQLEKYVIQMKTKLSTPYYFKSMRVGSLTRTRWIEEARTFNTQEAALKFCQDSELFFWRGGFLIIKLKETGL